MLHHINTIAAFSEYCKERQAEGPVQVLVLDNEQLAGALPEYDGEDTINKKELAAVISNVFESFFK